MLCLFYESNDFFLDIFWEVEMIHRSVHRINFFLKDNCFLVDIVDKYGKLSEKICLRDSTHDIDYWDKYKLYVVSGTKVVSKEEETRCIEADNVLVSIIFLKEFSLVWPAPEIIKRWDPFFIYIDDVEPNTGDEMDIHQKEKDKFYQLYGGLDVLFQVKIHNDPV